MKNHPVDQTKYYQKVKSIINNLYNFEMLENGSRYCLSVSDIIHINFIKTFMLVIFGISTLNPVRGSYNFYQKYIN